MLAATLLLAFLMNLFLALLWNGRSIGNILVKMYLIILTILLGLQLYQLLWKV